MRLIAFLLLLSTVTWGQKTMNVDLTITYKGAPLCYWDVTLKHGDVGIATGKTDDKGNVVFSNVRLLSLSVDASGIKKTNNGEKKWDVKGYIQLSEQGKANFDFEPLVKDAGMPASMLEAAWGLTLADCAKGAPTAKQEAPKQETQTTSSSTSASEKPAESKEEPIDMAKTQAESLQATKQMLESKISNIGSKITKKTNERNKLQSGTKEHSDLSYEIRDLELDRDLSQVKLEKTNAMIAKGNMPLNKAEREGFNTREDAIKAEQSKLKADQKAGKLFGGVEPVKTEQVESSKADTPKENPSKETTKENPSKETSVATNPSPQSDEKTDRVPQLLETELAQMSVVGLKKLKLDQNSKLASRKVSLKTKATLKPAQIELLEKEVKILEGNIILIDKEIAKRG